MRLRLLLVGRTDAGHVADGLDFYLERVRRSARIEVVIVREGRSAAPEARRAEESDLILKALRPGERSILLDERGSHLTSPAFAQRLGTLRDQGIRDVVFVIGGAYGVDDRVREKAHLIIALSAMVFPHQLVRVLFAEQLYRAFTLLEGRPYHHG